MHGFVPRKILITGASGFVGLFLLESLIANIRPDMEIVALHNRDLDISVKNRFANGVVWKRADITKDDLSNVTAAVDTVFHLAAYSTVDESEVNCRRMELVNVHGTRRLVDACKDSGVKHFIFVSSIAACEAGPPSVIEEETGFPVSAYGKTKKSAEELLLGKVGDGFEVTILRPTALFGENHLGSVFELVKAIDRGRFVLFGNGANHTNFYYVRDFVNVLTTVQHNPSGYGQIFIAADKPCSLYEFVSYISNELGPRRIPKIPVILGAAIALGCDIASKVLGKTLTLSTRRFRAMTRDAVYSNQKLTRMLGILPAYGISVGVTRAIDYYRSAGLIRLRK